MWFSLDFYDFCLQSLIADNDGVMDAPGIFSEQTRPLIKVNSLLFTTLSVFLSWTGLQQEENKHTLTGKLIILYVGYLTIKIILSVSYTPFPLFKTEWFVHNLSQTFRLLTVCPQLCFQDLTIGAYNLCYRITFVGLFVMYCEAGTKCSHHADKQARRKMVYWFQGHSGNCKSTFLL